MDHALRVFAGELVTFRRVWRGSVMSTLGTPIAFLAAMGLGLGSLVDDAGGQATLDVSYVAFVASGLMAASAMQNGFGEGAWPVMAGLKWRRSYEAMMVTPIGPAGLLGGRLLWGAVSLTVNLIVYGLVAVAFGALTLGPAMIAVVPALVTGLAFQAGTTGFTASLSSDTGLTNAFRFGVVPLFLFSGTFFPVEQLPGVLRAIAVATPLFHGVELTRKLALPGLVPPTVSALAVWVHALYLAVLLAAGIAYGWWRLRRRLYA